MQVLNLNTLYLLLHFSLTVRHLITNSGKALMFNPFNISSAQHPRQVSTAFQTPEIHGIVEFPLEEPPHTGYRGTE